jgi:IS5 family transposase
MQDSAAKLITAFVDLGYRNVNADNPDVHIVHRSESKRVSEQERKLLKRCYRLSPSSATSRAATTLHHCYLKGEAGDRLCATDNNVRQLQRMIVKNGVVLS